MANDWYIKINNVEHGPFTSDRLKQLAQQGKVTHDTPVKKGQAGTWHRASDVRGLFPTNNDMPVAAPPPPPPPQVNPQQPSAFVPVISPPPPPALPPTDAWTPWLEADATTARAPAGSASPGSAAAPTNPQSPATKPCPYCGEVILVVAKKCKHCGEFLDHGSKTRRGAQAKESDKRIVPLFLLWLFLGGLGAHAFYAGRVVQGFFYLFAFVFWIVWAAIVPSAIRTGHGEEVAAGLFFGGIVIGCVEGLMLLSDFIRILVGAYKDGNGHKITKWT